MSYRTKHGAHYHEMYGCHGATIPCDTKGLMPCSDCCGGTSRGRGSDVPGTQGAPSHASQKDGGSGSVTRRSQGHDVTPSHQQGGRSSNRKRPMHHGRRIPNEAGVSYTGYFFDPDQMKSLMAHLEQQGLGSDGLSRTIACPHVTLSYMPEDAHEGSFGTTQRMLVTGYGNDGRNEGVKVELIGQSPDEALAAMERGVACPHVTLSVSEDGKPVDTRYLDFKPISEPFEMIGTYGGYRPSERVAITEPTTSAGHADSQRPAQPTRPVPQAPSGAAGLTQDAMFAVMDNPEIPRDGLVTDTRPIIREIRESRGMIAVMRGAPGCGKSTVIEGLGLESSVVSPDEIRLRVSGLETGPDGKLGISQRDNQLVWQMARQDVAKRCENGNDMVLVDAMHTRPRDIRQWQRVAEASGYKLVVVDLTDVPRDVAHQRNAGRIEWKQVPEHVIDRFYDVARGNTRAIRHEFPTVDRRGFRDIIKGLRGEA